jgi:hypothetical protein
VKAVRMCLEDVRDVHIDIVERDQISHVEDNILFHIYFHRQLRSEDIVDDDKDQPVKG